MEKASAPKASLSVYVRTTIFYIVLVVFTIIFTSTATIFGPALPYEKRFKWIIQGYTKFVITWLKISCNIHYELYGTDNIPETPCIICSKHQSTWETFFLQTLFAPQTQVIKKELLNIPFFGWAFSLVEPIAIDRNNRKDAIKQVISQGTEKLNRGVWVLIFPEGTRIPPGEKKEFSRGGATLSKETGSPLLPVAHNAGEHWPNHSLLKHPGTIKVVFGPLIQPSGKAINQINSEVETWINHTVDNIRLVNSDADLLSYALK